MSKFLHLSCFGSPRPAGVGGGAEDGTLGFLGRRKAMVLGKWPSVLRLDMQTTGNGLHVTLREALAKETSKSPPTHTHTQ